MEAKQYVVKSKATGKYLESVIDYYFKGDPISKVLDDCFKWTETIHEARVYHGISAVKNSMGRVFGWNEDHADKRRILYEHVEFISVKPQVVAE